MARAPRDQVARRRSRRGGGAPALHAGVLPRRAVAHAGQRGLRRRRSARRLQRRGPDGGPRLPGLHRPEELDAATPGARVLCPASRLIEPPRASQEPQRGEPSKTEESPEREHRELNAAPDASGTRSTPERASGRESPAEPSPPAAGLLARDW